MDKISVDSNILIYAEGTDDHTKREIVVSLIKRIGPGKLLLTVQAAGETLRWLLGRGKIDKRLAIEKMQRWFFETTPVPMTTTSFVTACDIINRHSFQFWDAHILAASAEAGANILLSEDMQHGFKWNGVSIVNPFKLTDAERLILIPENTIH